MKLKHWGIFITNESHKSHFINSLFSENKPEEFKALKNKKGLLFSKKTIEYFIDEEEKHETKLLTSNNSQRLKTMSSGEQKRVLLAHLIAKQPKFLVLDDPFDNLDISYQKKLKEILQDVSTQTSLIQIVSRITDLIPEINSLYGLDKKRLIAHKNLASYKASLQKLQTNKKLKLPITSQKIPLKNDELIRFKNVNVSYENRIVVKNINWVIKQGEFWQLIGKNGSGKTTLLAMITGDNPKGYGQDLFIFGHKKGTGESVWDIKKKIGYFTPTLTENFTGYHSVAFMLISGFTDSIGLYTKPTEAQLRIANEWLAIGNLTHLKNALFHDLTMGQKRLVMLLRAMIKQPLLLILDEPTAGLDDQSAMLFTSLVNIIAHNSNTTILYVSHRNEPNLNPTSIFELTMSPNGSTGTIV